MATKVRAYIARVGNGTYRIFCQRAKRKWWFELGKHRETDVAFERALRQGTLSLEAEIVDATKLF